MAYQQHVTIDMLKVAHYCQTSIKQNLREVSTIQTYNQNAVLHMQDGSIPLPQGNIDGQREESQ
jgi:hypothetical protein